MDQGEIDDFIKAFRKQATTKEGLEMIWTLWSFSPYFLYNLDDRSTPDPQKPGYFKRTPYERATQLAYFVSGKGPDSTLMAKAAAGSLSDPASYKAEFDRLFEGNDEHLNRFTRQWLSLEEQPPVGASQAYRTDTKVEFTISDDNVINQDLRLIVSSSRKIIKDEF